MPVRNVKSDQAEIESIISEFSINGLNGTFDVRCVFVDNKLVLVGENGYGKTTVLTLLYYVLTRQWIKIRRTEFKQIVLVIKGNTLSFTKSELNISSNKNEYSQEIESYISDNELEDIIEELGPNYYREIARSLGVPLLYVRQYIEGTMSLSLSENVQNIEKILIDSIDFQVLYLPTYRRIEQDIRRIFPEMAPRLRDSLEKINESNKNFTEFVEFGMGDVEKLVADELEALREKFRTSLLDLTSRFLKGILSKNYSINSKNQFDSGIYDILNSKYSKALEKTLDIEGLENIIRSTFNKKTKSDYDRIVQYFWQQLTNVYFNQYIASSNIIGLADVIDSYLVNKSVLFNSQEHTLVIYHNKSKKKSTSNSFFAATKKIEKQSEIKLKHLSSGEKQIVSLFAHLYLGSASRAFVIIDEPELSLSLDWQKKLLVDITAVNKVVGLFAVTHSPYIFDNSMESFTHDIAEFTTRHK
jgi:ABC-type cobalamin/Fe3+-siderophores transport system ATPase subunit